MREILFRGKRVDNGEWVKGGIIPLDVESGYVFIAEPFLSASTLPVYEIIKHHTHLVIPETVGQYTGLTDKNGTKIFEGDIVMFGFSPCVVKYDLVNGRYMFYDKGIYLKNGFNVDTMKTKEIIGNIHDNPKLLGGD